MVNEVHSASRIESSAADGVPPADRIRVAFERAQLRGSEVCGLAIAVDRAEAWKRRGKLAEVITCLKQLCERAGEESKPRRSVLAHSEDQGLFVLFERTTPELAAELARKIAAGAHELRVGPGKLRPTFSIGLAHNRQREPIFFETFREVAHRGAEVAARAGGDRVSQTDLYGLAQKRVARAPEAAAERARIRRTYGLALDESPVFEAVEHPAPALPAGQPNASEVEIDPDEAVQTALLLAEERRRLRVEFEQATVRELQALEEARQSEHQQDVKLLERRIAKLARELEQAEGRILKLSKLKAGDPGVESIYRSVQGLDDGDEQFERKREMLETVFISNRQLLEMIAARRGGG